jgi:hypothetical protein
MKTLVLCFMFLFTFSSACASDFSNLRKVANNAKSLEKGMEATLNLEDKLELIITNNATDDYGIYAILENGKEILSGKITRLQNIIIRQKKILLAYQKGRVYYYVEEP